MFCLGTLINTGAVIAGGLLGITLKKEFRNAAVKY